MDTYDAITTPMNPNPSNFLLLLSNKWAKPIPFIYPSPTSKKNKGIAKTKTKKK